MYNKISSIITRITKVTNIKESDRFIEDLNINSLKFALIIFEIENEFDIIFDDDAMDSNAYSDMNNLIQYVSSKLNNN